MASITIKLFGVFRTDTKIACETINADKVIDIFDVLNLRVDEVYRHNLEADPTLEKPDPIAFKDAIVYIDGERCPKKSRKLNDGEEIWIMSPASGG